MNNTRKFDPPFTNFPQTEKVFPFKLGEDGNWYRYQSEEICLCEKLEGENVALKNALNTALAIESLDEENLKELINRCRKIIDADKQKQQ